jgi:hypothetical protein
LRGVTKGNILSNISLYSIPPIVGLKISVQLIPSWMNGISRLMSLSKYLIPQFLDVRHTNLPLYHNTPWSPFINLGDFSSLISHFIFLIFSSSSYPF